MNAMHCDQRQNEEDEDKRREQFSLAASDGIVRSDNG